MTAFNHYRQLFDGDSNQALEKTSAKNPSNFHGSIAPSRNRKCLNLQSMRQVELTITFTEDESAPPQQTFHFQTPRAGNPAGERYL